MVFGAIGCPPFFLDNFVASELNILFLQCSFAKGSIKDRTSSHIFLIFHVNITENTAIDDKLGDSIRLTFGVWLLLLAGRKLENNNFPSGHWGSQPD